MKKISMLLVMVITTLFLCSVGFASSGNIKETEEYNYSELEERPGNASLVTIEKLTTKEEKIEYYSEKCGNTTNGTVLYYLYEIQKYSFPVCFIGLVIASLNFFIIGNKKLDKREQGFGMLIAFGLGLIVFQVLPLLFAILVEGM